MAKLSTLYVALQVACWMAFLISVPLVLAARASRPQLKPWWRVIAVAAALGWATLNASFFLGGRANAAFSEEALHEEPPSILEIWQPSHSVPLRWGWIVGIAYLAILLGPYWFLRRRRHTRVISVNPSSSGH
jgi:hypothetical protein